MASSNPPAGKSPILTVKAMSRLSGLSPHTLRAWERRYAAVRPIRTATGRRTYDFADVARLKLLARLVEQGHSIGTIARLSTSELEALLKQTDPTKANTPASVPANLPQTVLQYLSPVRTTELVAELKRLSEVLPIRTFALEVISPLLREVGVRYQKKTLNVAQEHLLSAVIRDLLGQLFQSINQSTASSARRVRHASVALSTPEGYHHEFGILLAAILIAHQNIPVHYFGPNMPAAELGDALRGLKAPIVILGLTPLPESKSRPPLTEYLRKLRKASPDVEIWLGGDSRELKSASPMPHAKYFATLQELTAWIEKLTHEWTT